MLLIHSITHHQTRLPGFSSAHQKEGRRCHDLFYKKLHLNRLRTEFPLPQSSKVRNIQKTDVQKFLAQYNHLTSTSWNAVLTVTRDVFKHAVEDGIIAHSPAADIVYRPRKDRNKRLIPSFAEFQSIVESVRSQKFADTAKESADLIEFMGLAGLGQAECSDLTWGDINFKTSKVTIIRKKTSKEFSFPIYPALLPLLQKMDIELKLAFQQQFVKNSASSTGGRKNVASDFGRRPVFSMWSGSPERTL